MKQSRISKRLSVCKARHSFLSISLSSLILANCASSGANQQGAQQGNISAGENGSAQGGEATQGNSQSLNSNSQQEFAINIESSNGSSKNGSSNAVEAYDNYAANVDSGNAAQSVAINNVITEPSDTLGSMGNDLSGTALTNVAPATSNPLSNGVSIGNTNTPLNTTPLTNSAAAPANLASAPTANPADASNSTKVDKPQNISAPEGSLTWVGYNFNKSERKVEVQIVTSGSPTYRIFQEINKANQSELVVRFLNTKLRKKVRRDIDATEFRSPVAYVRMRHDPSFVHTDVVMTLRQAIQPTISTKGSNLMFTFEVGEQWFAPKEAENPIASAEILKDDNQGLSATDNALPGEAAPVDPVYINDPGKDAFSGKKDLDGAPLVPKSESGKELVPASEPGLESIPNGEQLLDHSTDEDKDSFDEIHYVIHGVAQADFSSDIPSGESFSGNSLLEDIPLEAATSENAQPLSTDVISNPQQSDMIGVSSGATSTTMPSKKKALRLDFRDAPVSQIIRMIANESSINFIISPEAGIKKTSISMKNVPWDVALKAVLESNRLGMQEISPGLVRIDYLKTFTEDRDAEEKARQATEALVPTKVLVMPLNYAKSDDAVKLAQAMLPKPTDPSNIAQRRNYDRFKAQSDPRSNSIIVEATPNVLATIKTLLERLDAQTPQVRIASRLVEVSSDISDGLGVSWGTPFSFDPGRGLGFGTLPFPNYMTSQFAVDPGGAATPGGTAAFRFGSINNVLALDLKLRLYETRRQADTLQTQDVVVQDNEKATITAGSSDFFTTAAGVGSTGGLAEVAYNLSLNVLPHITADGAVQMKLDIKGDSPALSTSSAAASKSTRQLTTTLLKRSGETAVIGGLYSSDQTKVQRGIPYLSRLPIIGALFRTNEAKDSKKDLLIMVTPTIVGMSNSAIDAGSGVIPPPTAYSEPPTNRASNVNSGDLAPSQGNFANGSGQQAGGGQNEAIQNGSSQNASSQNASMQNGQSSDASLESNGLE